MRGRLWQGMVAVVLGGALAAAAMGGASCDNNNGTFIGSAGGFAASGGTGGAAGNANQSVYNMQLTGAQVVPSTTSNAAANVQVTLDQSTGAVKVTGSFMNLSSTATAAHIHGPAAVGSNGTVLIPLTVPAATSGTVTGSANMSSSEMNDMVGGMSYVDIHSMSYANGEIRAQIVP